MDAVAYQMSFDKEQLALLRDSLDLALDSKRIAERRVTELLAENAKLRKLVSGLVYATHPADRARLIADAAEFGIEVDA